MHLSENEGIEGISFAVTGGLGFVGSNLCLELVRRGARLVRAFDLRPTSPWSDQLLNHGVQLLQADITKKKDVERALRGVDCVFHLASFGMSGKEMLQYGRVDAVNINGTCHVLEACHENGVRRLVYVSTYNVVFGGKEIVNGNESLPYFPMDDHADPYGRSKSIAEQLVLKSNGRPFKENNGKHFYTCAIRPAAIYGPGEERHLPRIVNYAKFSLLRFRIGETNVKSDWVYVDNLILALILASMGLLDDIPGRGKQPIAAGQPYFISDGSPVNTFEFLSPLLKGLDYEIPKASLDVPKALFLGKVFSVIYTIMYPLLNKSWLPQPFILPSEVHKVGVTHYFSYLKAKEELGYTPLVSPRDGMAKTILYWQDRKNKSLDVPPMVNWVVFLTLMFLLSVAAFLPAIGPVALLRSVVLLLFRSVKALRITLAAILVIHIGEATYALQLAKKVDPENKWGWFWQTLVVGIPSLTLLHKRAKNNILYQQDRKNKSLDVPPMVNWVVFLTLMFLLSVAAFLPAIGPVALLRSVVLLLFRSVKALRITLAAILIIHIGEATYALQLAKKVDPENKWGWFWQTLVVGVPSLTLLHKRAKNKTKTKD